jgi:hypothetical protein
MNLNSTLSPAAVPLTMSSREIAELTGKELSCDARHSRHAGQLEDDQNWSMFATPERRTYTTAFLLDREQT